MSTESHCVQVATYFAQDLIKEPVRRQTFDPKALCITLNALTRWPDQSPCWQLSLQLSQRLGSAEQPWRVYDVGLLAQACHPLSHLHRAEDTEIQSQIQNKLHGLAACWDLHREDFESASVLSIADHPKSICIRSFSARDAPIRLASALACRKRVPGDWLAGEHAGINWLPLSRFITSARSRFAPRQASSPSWHQISAPLTTALSISAARN